jgi:hypothetical protein
VDPLFPVPSNSTPSTSLTNTHSAMSPPEANLFSLTTHHKHLPVKVEMDLVKLAQRSEGVHITFRKKIVGPSYEPDRSKILPRDFRNITPTEKWCELFGALTG